MSQYAQRRREFVREAEKASRVPTREEWDSFHAECVRAGIVARRFQRLVGGGRFAQAE